jgi:hypothetical protein
MKLKDAVRFKDELFFNGSVEIDCIYDDRDLAQRAADSYVFHSRRSFTSSDDGQIDTIELIHEVFNRAFADEEENPFINAISGYGSGKSHLCTAVAALFANNDTFLKKNIVLENIKNIDTDTYNYINNLLVKPNIVFAINGMANVDLTMLLNNQVKQYLEISNITIPLFDDLERVYDGARLFVDSNYENANFQKAFHEILAEAKYKNINPDRNYICSNISDDRVFGLINEVSIQVTGNRFQIENFLNPRLILEEVGERLCGEGKPFGKIIVIFDEIGRYIEWVADKASIDSSSMQQLYEGVKNSKGKAVFLSFIQFPLATYFQHLNAQRYKAVSPYVDRYKTARNFHLSTLMETVFANLVEITDTRYFTDYRDLHSDLLRWNPDLNHKFIWSDFTYFSNVICDKLMVFHPLTIALLARLSEYTQKRGPMVILKELLDEHKNADVETLQSISPVSVLNTSFKDDILRMEQAHLVKSFSVSNYDQLISKPEVKPHLGMEELFFLQAILVIDLLQLKPKSKDDFLVLLKNLTGLEEDILKESENQLAFNLGVLKYDDELNYYSIVLDSVGQRDFDSFFVQKRSIGLSDSAIYKPDMVSSKLQKLFNKHLKDISTDLFGKINTLEWQFPQIIKDSRDFLKQFIQKLVIDQKVNINPDKPRGAMVWVYLNGLFNRDIDAELDKIESIAKELDLENSCTQIAVIIDSDNQLLNLVIDNDTISSLSEAEREKYHAFVYQKEQKIQFELEDMFLSMQNSAEHIIDNKLTRSAYNARSITNSKVKRLFNKYVPFQFAGFDKVRNNHAVREIVQVMKTFARPQLSMRTFESGLQPNTFNRLGMVFGEYGWEVFEDEDVGYPKEDRSSAAFKHVDKQIAQVSEENSLELKEVFEALTNAPYGMNVYSATLLILLTMSFRRDTLSFNINNEELNFSDWVLKIHKENDTDSRIINDTRVDFFDIKKQEEAVRNAVQRILDERSIDALKSLDRSVGYLLEETYASDELNSKVVLAKERLQSAKKIVNAYLIEEESQNQFRKYIHDANEGVPNILKYIDELISSWDKFKEDVSKKMYLFPVEWQIDFDNVLSDSRESVNNHFEAWFSRNRTPKNHNVEPYIAFSKKIEKGLYVLGCSEFAIKVNRNISDISETYTWINQINERVANLMQNQPVTIEESESLQKRIKQLEEDIKISPLKEHHKREYNTQLGSLLKRIEKQLDALNTEVGELWEFLADDEIKTLDGLIKFISDLEGVIIKIGNGHSDYSYLSEILDNSQLIKQQLLDLESSFIDRQDIEKRMNLIRDEFRENIEEDPEALTCKKLFDEFENQLYEKIKKDANMWILKLPDENSIMNFNDKRLESYLEYIDSQPNFLDDEDLAIVRNKKLLILSQLDTHMHKEIITLFDNIKTRDKKIELVNALKARL